MCSSKSACEVGTNATLVATPNRGSVVNILLNETHLDWLLVAISASEQFDIKEKSNKKSK